MTLAWQDGTPVAQEQAHVSIGDRGLLLGDGLFETVLVHKGRPFDLNAHLRRLENGLDVLGFAGAVDLEKLRADVALYLAAEGASDAVLRVTVTRGAGPRGLAPPEKPLPMILMTLSPVPPARDAPLALHVAASTRRNEHSPISRIKALPYLDNLIAFQEARHHGCDDALMLNTAGAVACASVANLFLIRDGRLETPPVSDGALPGMMRALALSLAEQAGLQPAESSLRPIDVQKAEHVFLTNSVRGVTEAGSVNGAELRLSAVDAVQRLRKLIASCIESA